MQPCLSQAVDSRGLRAGQTEVRLPAFFIKNQCVLCNERLRFSMDYYQRAPGEGAEGDPAGPRGRLLNPPWAGCTSQEINCFLLNPPWAGCTSQEG